MDTAIKHPVPALGVRVLRCQKLQMTAEPGLAQDGIAVPIIMTTVGVKELNFGTSSLSQKNL